MLRSKIKNILKEELGVPKSIVSTAKDIYEKILNTIPEDADFNELDGFDEVIVGDFSISEDRFNKVEFELNLHKYDSIEIMGMSTTQRSKITKNYNIKSLAGGQFNISFKMAAPEDVQGSDIKEFIRNNRLEFVGSIAHELKHRYDIIKNPKNKIKNRVKYEISSSNNFGRITAMNEFIHFIYYGHIIESLVRPSEIAALIEDGEISKKEFYNFLTSTRTFKRLKKLKDFKYETFISKLREEIPEIKNLFDHIDIDYITMTDDEIIDELLRLVHINFNNWQAEKVHSMLLQHPLEQLFGFNGEKNMFFENFLKHLKRYGDDYKKFFKSEIKLFNFVGDRMIRKIMKLYDFAK